MSSATGTSIMARARTLATQVMSDANQSVVIDSLGGIRTLLNNSIRELYRRKANDVKFRHDITVDHDISIASGTGTLPDEVMREFLHSADFSDDNSSLISYLDYAVDAQSTLDQLGYAWLVGDSVKYIAPSPDLEDYSGSLFVSVPSFPEFPASMDDEITFPSAETIDDLVLLLAQAITGQQKFQVISV